MVVELYCLVVERKLVKLGVEEEFDSVGGELESQTLQKRNVVVNDLIITEVEGEPDQLIYELV